MKKYVIVFLFFTSLLLSFQVDNGKIKEVSKIRLGHYLFFEKKLSADGSKSCSSCHDPQFAFTDGYRRPLGIYADELAHNTPTLINVGAYRRLNWANPTLKTLEIQMLRPLFGKSPIEMGNDEGNTLPLQQLSSDSLYHFLYRDAFGENPFTWQNTIAAISAYLQTLNSYGACYDDFLQRKYDFGEAEKAGYALFFSKKINCARCHKGLLFTDEKYHVSAIKTNSKGVFEVTKKRRDLYKFRTPTLRNVALTAPYMHDGSIGSLSAAVAHCATYNSAKKLKSNELYPLVAFLNTLTDSTIFKQYRFLPPL
jgi:cytochrome c peroxidase